MNPSTPGRTDTGIRCALTLELIVLSFPANRLQGDQLIPLLSMMFDLKMSCQMTAAAPQPKPLSFLAKATRKLNRGNRPGRKSAHSQALYLQELCIEAAEKAIKQPSALASLAKVWNDLEDRKRILKGRPLPCASPSTAGRARGNVIELGKQAFAEAIDADAPSAPVTKRKATTKPPTPATTEATEPTTIEGEGVTEKL